MVNHNLKSFKLYYFKCHRFYLDFIYKDFVGKMTEHIIFLYISPQLKLKILTCYKFCQHYIQREKNLSSKKKNVVFSYKCYDN